MKKPHRLASDAAMTYGDTEQTFGVPTVVKCLPLCSYTLFFRSYNTKVDSALSSKNQYKRATIRREALRKWQWLNRRPISSPAFSNFRSINQPGLGLLYAYLHQAVILRKEYLSPIEYVRAY